MRTFFLRSFGCQMNDHDAERISALLEDDGLERVASVDDADVIVYNTCTVRRSADDRLAGHLGEAARVKALDPRPARGGGRLPAAGRARGALRALSRSSTSPSGRSTCTSCRRRSPAASSGAIFDGEGALSGELPAHRERPFQAWVQVMSGCTQRLLLLHRARRPRPRAQPPAGRDRLPKCARWSTTACSRSRCWARTSTPTATTSPAGRPTLRRAAAQPRRHRGVAPLRFTTSHPRDLSDELVASDRRAAVGLRARPPAGPVGLRPRTGGDGTRVYHGVVSGEGGRPCAQRSPTSRSRPT